MAYYKLYEWMGFIPISAEERIIYAFIYQFTVNGTGFFAGYASMSSRVAFPKATCKKAAEHLQELGAITISHETLYHSARIVLRTTPNFAQFYIDNYAD